MDTNDFASPIWFPAVRIANHSVVGTLHIGTDNLILAPLFNRDHKPVIEQTPLSSISRIILSNGKLDCFNTFEVGYHTRHPVSFFCGCNTRLALGLCIKYFELSNQRRRSSLTLYFEELYNLCSPTLCAKYNFASPIGIFYNPPVTLTSVKLYAGLPSLVETRTIKSTRFTPHLTLQDVISCFIPSDQRSYSTYDMHLASYMESKQGNTQFKQISDSIYIRNFHFIMKVPLSLRDCVKNSRGLSTVEFSEKIVVDEANNNMSLHTCWTIPDISPICRFFVHSTIKVELTDTEFRFSYQNFVRWFSKSRHAKFFSATELLQADRRSEALFTSIVTVMKLTIATQNQARCQTIFNGELESKFLPNYLQQAILKSDTTPLRY